MMHALLGLDSLPILAQEASATYLRYITGGGVVGYVILGLSVVAVALGLAQLVHVRAASLAPSSLMDDVNTMAEQGQFGRALERLKLADADCFAGRVLRAGLKRASQGPLGPLEARSAMEDAGGEESMQLEQRLDWLAAIANIATLLGLLGTVQGMIGAFETVASSAVNDSGYYQRLAENISIALITTFQGSAWRFHALRCTRSCARGSRGSWRSWVTSATASSPNSSAMPPRAVGGVHEVRPADGGRGRRRHDADDRHRLPVAHLLPHDRGDRTGQPRAAGLAARGRGSRSVADRSGARGLHPSRWPVRTRRTHGHDG